MFGYTLGGFAVIFDLGRYWHVYNLLLPWYAQLNSVMYEVALCVMAYVVVLWIEFAPAFLERCGLHGIKRGLDRWMFVFAALGVLLPTMHQSSLGSMLLVMGIQALPAVVHRRGCRPCSSISALAMGYAVVMFEATVVSKTFALPSEQALIAQAVDGRRLDHGRLARAALGRSLRPRRAAAGLRRRRQGPHVLDRERLVPRRRPGVPHPGRAGRASALRSSAPSRCSPADRSIASTPI